MGLNHFDRYVADNLPPGFVSPEEAKALNDLACRAPAVGGRIVEVGCYLGRSTVALAAVSSPDIHEERPHVYSVDLFGGRYPGYEGTPESHPVFDAPGGFYDQWRKNISRYIDDVTPLAGASWDVSRHWRLPIDLLFIDGSHAEAAVRVDVVCWSPHLRDGGVIAMHDVGDCPGPTAAWESLVAPHVENVGQAGSLRWGTWRK